MNEMNETSDLAATRTSVLEPETRLLPTSGGDAGQTRLLAKNDENAISTQSPGQDVTSDTILNGNKAKYEYVGEIAQGGMGAILKGRDVDLGRDLSVKVLLESHKDDPDLVHRFVEEAQIAGQLQRVLTLHGLGRLRIARPGQCDLIGLGGRRVLGHLVDAGEACGTPGILIAPQQHLTRKRLGHFLQHRRVPA